MNDLDPSGEMPVFHHDAPIWPQITAYIEIVVFVFLFMVVTYIAALGQLPNVFPANLQ